VRRERIDKTLARIARDMGVEPLRLRRNISVHALTQVLRRAREEGVVLKYYVKGRSALEIRLGANARTTKDVDIALSGDRQKRFAILQEALNSVSTDSRFAQKNRTVSEI